jgi:hypothetical protein
MMARRNGTGRTRATAAIRAGWAGALLVVPEHLLRLAGHGPVPPAAVATVRVLGARHLLQALVCAAAPRAPIAGAGAVVDTLHTGTCLGLAAVSPTWRRAALLDAAVETAFAASGWSHLAGGQLRTSSSRPTAPR